MTDLPILNGHTALGRTHERITDTVAQTVERTLRTAAIGERVTWETGLILAPGQQGFVPVVAIYMQTPSPILGQFCAEMTCIEPHQATAPNVAQAVTEMVGRLFTVRARVAVPNG